MTLEHIWPESLGGNLTDDSLRTDHVCETCNNLCGLYIDGPFIKNFFIKNDQSQIGNPYVYLGQLDINPVENRICDYWTGKRGMVFHWIPREEDFLTHIGGDPRKKKESNAYLHLLPSTCFPQEEQTQIEESARNEISSFLQEFKRINCYAGNFEPDSTMLNRIQLIPENDSLIQSEVTAIHILAQSCDNNVPIKITVQLGFEKRFLAKLSLGMGYKLLGEKYLDTEWANRLRELLWEKDPDKRQTNGRGYSFEPDSISQHVSLPNCWTMGVIGIGSRLGLSVVTPGQKMMCMTISEDLALWEHLKFDPHLDGIINIIDPRNRKIELGIRLMEMITRNRPSNPEDY